MVIIVIKICNLYYKTKAIKHKPYGQLRSIPLKDKVWKSFSMDMIVKLAKSQDPISDNFYDNILIIIEQLIKYVKFVLYNEVMSVEQIIIIIEKEVFNIYKQLDEIITDRTRIFALHYWQLLTKYLGIWNKLFMSYYP
jgi:hypothetical protein